MRWIFVLWVVTLGWAELPADLDIPNLRVVKDRIREYYETGRQAREVDLVCGRACDYLETNQRRYQGQRPTLVLDIDETALSNYPHLLEVDFAYLPEAWKAWVNQGAAPALPGVLKLYRKARQLGVQVVFLTGRPERQRAITESNLRQSGYDSWDLLLLKPNDSKSTTHAFKVAERRRLTEAGYRIVVNVGDQPGDLEGGYSESVYKIPNPLYYLPFE